MTDEDSTQAFINHPAIERKISPSWIVLKKTNGHFEQLGQTTERFDTFEAAQDRMASMAKQYQKQTFAIFEMRSGMTYESVPVIETVEG